MKNIKYYLVGIILFILFNNKTYSQNANAIGCWELGAFDNVNGQYFPVPDNQFCEDEQVTFQVYNSLPNVVFNSNVLLGFFIEDAQGNVVLQSPWYTAGVNSPYNWLVTLSIPPGNYSVVIYEVADSDQNGIPDPDAPKHNWGGCNNSYLHYDFTVLPLPKNLLILASPPCQTTICYVSAVSSQAPNPIQDVTINFGDGTPTLDVYTSPVCHTFPGTGTYIVTQTVTTDCGTVTQQYPITITTQIDLVLSNQFVCDNPNFNASVLIQSGTSPFTYQWSNGSTSSNPIYVLNPGSNTIGVTVTDANGCTGNEGANIEYDDNCCKGNTIGQSELTINAPSLAAFINANPTLFYNVSIGGTSYKALNPNIVPPNSVITFNGSVQIDENLLLINHPNIWLGSNSSLIINQNRRLRIDNSVLGPCEDMWDGIKHQHSNSWLTIRNNSVLWGAKAAVQPSNNAPFELINSTFKENYRSVQASNCGANYNGVISGCNFSCAINTLLPPYFGQTTDAAIFATNMQGWIIGDYVNYNQFNNLKSGIVAQTSIIEVQGNKFTNIRTSYNSGGISNAWHGAAIYAFGGTNFPQPTALTVRTYNSNPVNNLPPTFENCDAGIRTLRSILTAEQNVMNQVHSGIAAGSNIFGQLVKIRWNYINNTRYGVQLNNNFASLIIVNSNIINVVTGLFIGNNSTFGIKIDGVIAKLTNQPDDEIYSNFITNGKNGIYLNNVQRILKVMENVITLSGTHSNGINLENSRLVQIEGSEISGQSSSTHYAIRVNKSTDYILNCNATQNTKVGLYFLTNCQTAVKNIYENRMQYHYYGFMLDRVLSTPGYIGSSVGTVTQANNNKFVGNFSSGFDTYNRTIAGAINQTPSIFNKPNSINYQYANDQNGSNPFGLSIGNSLASLSSIELNNCNMPGGLANPNNPEDWMLQTANDSLNFVYLAEGSEWIKKQDLYKVLEESEELRESEEVLETFYEEKQPTALGKLEEANLELTKEELLELQTQAEWETKLDSIDAKISIVPDENLMASNEKWILSICAKIMRSGIESLTEEEVNQVTSLANECPYVAGNGVFKARAIHAWFEPGFYVDDKQLCYEQLAGKNGDIEGEFDEISKQMIPVIEDGTQLTILGNPISDELNFSISNTKSQKVQVYSITGALIVDLKKETYKIDASQLSNGLYILSVTTDNGNKINKQFEVRK